MLQVRVDGWAEFARDLRRLAPEARKEMLRELRLVAKKVATEAATLAPTRTGRLRRAIRVSQRSGSPAVVVVHDQAPHARTVHYGRRHPLFGNREHWYANPAVPFLQRAADANRPEALDAVETALDRALDRAGWR